MASGGHYSRSILPEPEVPTEDSNAESNQKATMKELSDLTEFMNPSGSQRWPILGSVISADTKLWNYPYMEFRKHFAADRLLQGVYPLLYDVTTNDIKKRLRVYRDIPFDDIVSVMKEMKGQCDDEILRAIFDKCDSFKTFYKLMHLPHLDYEKRCQIFNFAEHNILQEEKKNAIKKFHKEIQDKKDDDDLFDALLEMKDLFQLGEKLTVFHERIEYLKCLEVSNELFKATPHEIGMHLDDLIMRKNIAFKTRSLTQAVPFEDLIGARVNNITGGFGTTGYVVKDGSQFYATTVGHVLLSKRHQWWKENVVEHSIQCKYISNGTCSCDFKCSVGIDNVENFVADKILYDMGDHINGGHETALLGPLKRNNPGSRQTAIFEGQKPLLTLVCRGQIRHPQDGSTVYKIGQKSGLTKGIVHENDDTDSNYEDATGMRLNNQIIVKWQAPKIPFSENGDSGAPVFFVEGNEIIAVGVVEASNVKLERSYVSPIKSISRHPLTFFRFEAFEDIPKLKKNLLYEFMNQMQQFFNPGVQYR